MSSTSGGSDEGNGWEYGAGSAREFAKRRLSESEEPVRPAVMSRSYGCSGGHMRKVMSELADEGEAERVGHGRYVEAEDQQEEREQAAEAEREETRDAVLGEGEDGSEESVEEVVDVAVDEAVDGEPDGAELFGGVSPGMALVGASVVLVVLVLLAASMGDAPDGPEAAEESGEDGESDEMAAFEGEW